VHLQFALEGGVPPHLASVTTVEQLKQLVDFVESSGIGMQCQLKSVMNIKVRMEEGQPAGRQPGRYPG